MIHMKTCGLKVEDMTKELELTKKFTEFVKVLEEELEKVHIDNSDMKRQNFFDTKEKLFIENLTHVFDKVFDRFTSSFKTPKHLKLMFNKIEAIKNDFEVYRNKHPYLYAR